MAEKGFDLNDVIQLIDRGRQGYETAKKIYDYFRKGKTRFPGGDSDRPKQRRRYEEPDPGSREYKYPFESKHSSKAGEAAAVRQRFANPMLYRFGKERRRRRTIDNGMSFQDVKRKVVQLERAVESLDSELIIKERRYNTISVVRNRVNYNRIDVNTKSMLDNYFTDIPFWDKGTDTLVSANVIAGTVDNTFKYQTYSECILMNNWNIPYTVRIYCLVPNEDSSITPTQALTNGYTDQVYSNTTGGTNNETPLMYPTDYKQFVRLWKVIETQKAYLRPGERMKCVHATGWKQYNRAILNNHTDSYQDVLGAHSFMVRIEGPYSHEVQVGPPVVVNLAMATQAGTVLMAVKTKTQIKYDGEADFKVYKIIDQYSAQTPTYSDYTALRDRAVHSLQTGFQS